MVKVSLLDSRLIEQDWVNDDPTHCGPAHKCIVTGERRFPPMVSKMSVKQFHKCKHCGCTMVTNRPVRPSGVVECGLDRLWLPRGILVDKGDE